LAAHLLSCDTFVQVMRPEHPLVRRKEVSWKKVAKLPLIGPHKDNPIRERLDASLLADGITLSRVHEVYLPLTMVSMVEAGLGVAVMTAVSRLAQALGLVIRTITGPVMRREVSLLYHADRSLSPTAQRFRDLLVRKREQITRQ
jgi:LysR family carnitine catabolism transcriptional activator